MPEVECVKEVIDHYTGVRIIYPQKDKPPLKYDFVFSRPGESLRYMNSFEDPNHRDVRKQIVAVKNAGGRWAILLAATGELVEGKL